MIGPPEGCFSIKDPTAIHHGGAWHLFATVRAAHPTHRIEYLRFDRFPPARIERTFLELGAGMVAAPQVFLHRPSGRFHLLFQAQDPFRYGPAISTNESLDPSGWTAAAPIELEQPSESWLDFWAIGDGGRIHLFFTSLDGRMWRAETEADRFPRGFSAPVLALQGDLFEASHLFRAGELFLCVVEAKRLARRHQRWFAAERLDGPWTPLGTFAAKAADWADSISHAELIRSGIDERMEIDPARPRLLFQGASDLEVLRPYARIPWRIGLLESLHPIPIDEILQAVR